MPANPFAADVRTRFIATLGPASASREVMRELFKAGVTVFRNNFAHADYGEYAQRVQLVRELNEEYGAHVQMQADIQGTNIRMGVIEGGQVELVSGREYAFVTNGQELREGELRINDDFLHGEVKEGEPITFVDGALEGVILKLEGRHLTVHVTVGGTLKQKKSINVPETEMNRSSITEKDRADLEFLIERSHVDWLALSFVGSAADVLEVRDLVGDRDIKLTSKIERRAAITNLQEIIAVSDGIMIARGDLGVELPMEEVPVLAKRMILLSHLARKPVITATQMMQSMTDNHRPTRAEVSDVANAVYDRSDAVMLSDETAAGKYPVEALQTMVRIVRRIEEEVYGRPNYFEQFGA